MRKYNLFGIIAAMVFMAVGAGLITYTDRHPIVIDYPKTVSVTETMTVAEHVQQSTVMVLASGPGGSGSGSGVVISRNGIVLTARHVAADANDISIVNYDGSVEQVQYWVIDKASDCAILFTGTQHDIYSPLAARDPIVGEAVTVCGSPFGAEYKNYYTSGIVSKFPIFNDYFSPKALFMMDAAINPGNSGGPVFESTGKVLGLAIGGDRRGAGLYYATPICDVVNLLSVLDPVY